MRTPPTFLSAHGRRYYIILTATYMRLPNAMINTNILFLDIMPAPHFDYAIRSRYDTFHISVTYFQEL